MKLGDAVVVKGFRNCPHMVITVRWPRYGEEGWNATVQWLDPELHLQQAVFPEESLSPLSEKER